ncbi:hypothetical protein IEQ34_006782 [Dendrobium chrysotoxum]|uniref:Uncharacterized protein n=1 Tax=Dendrobium chrysotoxum TaxID=161865 RepID=A0AAV7H4M9_DENCH|nr:hypothetical protein IEQ34_006782 [Dendrobium chrysotoxum]
MNVLMLLAQVPFVSIEPMRKSPRYQSTHRQPSSLTCFAPHPSITCRSSRGYRAKQGQHSMPSYPSLCGPWQEHVRDDTIRTEIPKHSVERVADEGGALVLTPLGEAEVGGREGDDVEIDGVVNCGANDLGIGRGRQDGDAGATGSEELGHLWGPPFNHHPPLFNSLLISLRNPIIIPISYHPNK